MTAPIRADCTVPVEDVERWRAVEQAGTALIKHEYLSEFEWNNGWASHQAETKRLLESLRSALSTQGKGE